MFVSLIGTWIQWVAQSWLIFQLTNSSFLLGLVGFLSSIPMFILSLFGGVVADRANKRLILIVTQSAFMLLAFLLAYLTQVKLVTPGQIMVIATLNGIIMAFDAPSRQAMVVELVGKKHLMNAIALNSVSFNASRIIGPALAGVLVAGIGMSGCFYLNGISFLAVLVALVVIKLQAHAKPFKNNSALKDLLEGISFIKGNRVIVVLICIVGVSSLFGVSYVILMPVFAHDILHVGIKGLGILMSSSGMGALIGALALARLGDFPYKGKLLMFSSLLFSCSLVGFALSKSFFFSCLILLCLGGSSVVAMALVNTLLQTMVEDEFRGRVMSAFMLTFAGFMPFGNLLSGVVAHAFGVSLTVLLNGIICTFLFLVINLAFPQVRTLR